MNSQTATETQRFTSDIVWVGLSQIFVLLIGLVTLPALTKSYSTDTYGVWAQMLVTIGLLTPILTLQFATATVRFLAGEEDREKRRRIFGAMLWPIVAFVFLVFVGSLALKENLSTLLFGSPEYASLVLLTSLWATMEALFSLSLSYLRARKKIKRLSLVQLALAAVKMAVVVLLATRGYGLGWIATFIIVSEAVFVGTVFGMITHEIGFAKPSLEGLTRYLSFSLPQIPAGALLWIINASDRYFITHLLDLSHTGTYSASYTLGSLISLFYAPIGFVLLPSISKLWDRHELTRTRSYFEYSTKLFLALAIPASAGLYILSQPALGFLTTSQYMVGGGLVLLVAVGTIFLGLYQINAYIILLVQRTKWLPLMIGVAAAVNAGINIALIPKIGIMAAAISTIVACLVLATIVMLWTRKTLSYRVDFKFLGKVVGATVIMTACLRFIPTSTAWRLILAIIAGAAVFGLVLWLLRAFSAEDRRLIKEAVSGMNPKLRRGRSASRNPSAGDTE